MSRRCPNLTCTFACTCTHNRIMSSLSLLLLLLLSSSSCLFSTSFYIKLNWQCLHHHAHKELYQYHHHVRFVADSVTILPRSRLETCMGRITGNRLNPRGETHGNCGVKIVLPGFQGNGDKCCGTVAGMKKIFTGFPLECGCIWLFNGASASTSELSTVYFFPMTNFGCMFSYNDNANCNISFG